jgi:EAL and modified HD-GYP domain-containing signal transduction protein
MSLLRLIFGRSSAPAPAVPAPPRGDTLFLSGTGFDGADLTGPATVTVTLGDRTFTATATRRGIAHPAEFALTEIHEVIPEPTPVAVTPPPHPPPPPPLPAEVVVEKPAEIAAEVAIDPPAEVDAPAEVAIEAPGEVAIEAPGEVAIDAPAEVAIDAPGEVAIDAPAEVATEAPAEVAIEAPGEVAIDAPAEVAIDAPAEVAVEEPVEVVAEEEPDAVVADEEPVEVVADEVVAEQEPDEVVADEEPAEAVAAEVEAVDDQEIAVVRRPITNAASEVVGWELVAGGDGVKATAGLLLDVFGDIGLERLAGRHPAWVRIAPEFLLEVGTPPVRPDRVVLQLDARPVSDEVVTALRRLQFSGYTLALDGIDDKLLQVCGIVKISIADRTDDELRALIETPRNRNIELVATDVATPEELERAKELGFNSFQGDFFAKPDLTRRRRVGTGGVASLRAVAAVTAPDASFEDLERAITDDVGLSLKLLRYVNSAFFALPRTVESVREALTLLGTATVRRWATVVALASAAGDAPDELVELALQRARMCEVLGGSRELDAADGHFTVGLFSVADALLDSPMDEVLETLPFSEEIRAALLNREGPKGELLETVVAYERGEFPADDGGSLQGAYGDAVQWAGGAVSAAA